MDLPGPRLYDRPVRRRNRFARRLGECFDGRVPRSCGGRGSRVGRPRVSCILADSAVQLVGQVQGRLVQQLARSERSGPDHSRHRRNSGLQLLGQRRRRVDVHGRDVRDGRQLDRRLRSGEPAHGREPLLFRRRRDRGIRPCSRPRARSRTCATMRHSRF